MSEADSILAGMGAALAMVVATTLIAMLARTMGVA